MAKSIGGTHPENLFQQARVKVGISQEAAAEALDCGTRTIQGYEEGRCSPPISVLQKMKVLYACEFSDLIADPTDSKPPPNAKDIDPHDPSYRFPLMVNSVRYYPECPELSTYPLCPRCNQPMEREYQPYCDQCGQALDWKNLSHAVIILAHASTKVR